MEEWCTKGHASSDILFWFVSSINWHPISIGIFDQLTDNFEKIKSIKTFVSKYYVSWFSKVIQGVTTYKEQHTSL